MDSLIDKAAKHVSDIVRMAIKPSVASGILVVFDARTPLSRIVTSAYRKAHPQARFIDFDEVGAEAVIAAIRSLKAGDLVVLVQSSNFQLNEFRIRIELFQRGLATVDHGHLDRAPDERQWAIYVDALAFDPSYYHVLGRKLKERLDVAQSLKVICEGTELSYEGGMEASKLNVGDYAGMKNIGGTFPIGEVFTEPKNLTRVNGEARLFAFASPDHLVKFYEPFKIRIEKGVLVSHEGPPEFQAVMDQISTSEAVLVREFGLGLNAAMGKHRPLSDITAFERQKGLHFSLGEKHPIYKKPGMNSKKTHFHIDVFVDAQRITADGATIYESGEFLQND